MEKVEEITTKKPAKPKEASKTHETGNQEKLRDYIQGGIELVKQEKFEEAIKYLRNPDMAKSVGLSFNDEARGLMIRKTLNKEQIREASHLIAYNSGFKNGSGRAGKITIAYAYSSDPETTGKKHPLIPSELWQEIALIHLEEWLHGLQHIKGGSVAGYKDGELDVTAYLKRQGVALTDNFLALYNRHKIFKKSS